METKSCKFCGNQFTPKKRKTQQFCQQSCYQKWVYQNYEGPTEPVVVSQRECDFCSTNFVPSRMCNHAQRFCSSKCKTDDHAQKQREARALRRQEVLRVCPICQTTFSPSYSMREIYCSARCRNLLGKKVYKMMQTCYDATQTKKADHSHKAIGYSPNDLLAHLESFTEWETLKSGSWHLDHVFPIIAFVRRGITDISQICCLRNLQPLSGEANCSKNDKYDEQTFDAWLSQKAN
jgi:hypothetical protein